MKILFLVLILAILAVASPADELTMTEWQTTISELDSFHDAYAEQMRAGEVPPIKCGTPLTSYLNAVRPKAAAPLADYDMRHDTMSYTYGTPHFLLHYTNSGRHAVYQFAVQDSMPGVPDFIFEAGKTFEYVYQHTVADLGFPAALADFGKGGDDRIDVYFVDLGVYYGVTNRDSLIAGSNPPVGTAYLIMENDYEGFPGYESNRIDALRVTAAHEHLHTIQFGMDLSEVETNPDWGLSTSWVEMSATYMEEEHYDAVNDYYIYLPFFYDRPYKSLRAGTLSGSYQLNLSMYGKVVWPILLSNKFGPEIIREIWEGCALVAGPNWWQATDAAIRNNSGDTTNMAKVYREFALWNLFTHNWARGTQFFEEASNYPAVKLSNKFVINQYPVTINTDSLLRDSTLPDNLGCNYIILDNVSSLTNGMAITFSPNASYPWSLQFVGLPANPGNVGQPIFVDTTFYDENVGVITVPDPTQYSLIALIPSVVSGNGFKVNYAISVSSLSEGVSRPNGGEIWYAGSNQEISWYFDSDSVTFVNISYSTDNGTGWNDIIKGTSNANYLYDWQVPATPSESCLVRVANSLDTTKFDVSDGVFSIVVGQADAANDPFPNPAWIGIHDEVTFPTVILPGSNVDDIKILIMTVAGEKVRELSRKAQAGINLLTWDFKNDAGELVAAGPYIAIIDFSGESVTKKIMVLR